MRMLPEFLHFRKVRMKFISSRADTTCAVPLSPSFGMDHPYTRHLLYLSPAWVSYQLWHQAWWKQGTCGMDGNKSEFYRAAENRCRIVFASRFHIVFASHFLCPKWAAVRKTGSKSKKIASGGNQMPFLLIFSPCYVAMINNLTEWGWWGAVTS